MHISEKRRAQILGNPARIIVTSFAVIILAGSLLLMLPVCSKSGTVTPFLDTLFTATSATCVTGLVVVDTYLHWSVFGQLIILLMIQIGGLGLITFATFFNIAIGRRLGLRSMQLAQEGVSSMNMFDTTRLIKMIITISLVFEGIGALVLCTVFVPDFGAEGIYVSFFLAVSAYCNAGIDILGRQGAYASLTHYADNPVVLITIMALIICGGLGFIVWHDLYQYKKTHRLMLHTKIVLIITGILIFSGAVIFLALEWNNPATLKNMPVDDKIANAFFQSVTARTAGFNSVSVDGMTGATKLSSILLMFIGAAPGSTAGGIKVTTFVVLVMTVISVIRGREDTTVLGRRVDKLVVYKALAVFSLAGIAVAVSTSIIFFSSDSLHHISGIDALFESVSAFGTVGLSVGVTEVANSISRIALILTMFLGRVGPVSLALSLAMHGNNKHKGQVIPEGKILVG